MPFSALYAFLLFPLVCQSAIMDSFEALLLHIHEAKLNLTAKL